MTFDPLRNELYKISESIFIHKCEPYFSDIYFIPPKNIDEKLLSFSSIENNSFNTLLPIHLLSIINKKSTYFYRKFIRVFPRENSFFTLIETAHLSKTYFQLIFDVIIYYIKKIVDNNSNDNFDENLFSLICLFRNLNSNISQLILLNKSGSEFGFFDDDLSIFTKNLFLTIIFHYSECKNNIDELLISFKLFIRENNQNFLVQYLISICEETFSVIFPFITNNIDENFNEVINHFPNENYFNFFKQFFIQFADYIFLYKITSNNSSFFTNYQSIEQFISIFQHPSCQLESLELLYQIHITILSDESLSIESYTDLILNILQRVDKDNNKNDSLFAVFLLPILSMIASRDNYSLISLSTLYKMLQLIKKQRKNIQSSDPYNLFPYFIVDQPRREISTFRSIYSVDSLNSSILFFDELYDEVNIKLDGSEIPICLKENFIRQNFDIIANESIPFSFTLFNVKMNSNYHQNLISDIYFSIITVINSMNNSLFNYLSDKSISKWFTKDIQVYFSYSAELDQSITYQYLSSDNQQNDIQFNSVIKLFQINQKKRVSDEYYEEELTFAVICAFISLIKLNDLESSFVSLLERESKEELNSNDSNFKLFQIIWNKARKIEGWILHRSVQSIPIDQLIKHVENCCLFAYHLKNINFSTKLTESGNSLRKSQLIRYQQQSSKLIQHSINRWKKLHNNNKNNNNNDINQIIDENLIFDKSISNAFLQLIQSEEIDILKLSSVFQQQEDLANNIIQSLKFYENQLIINSRDGNFENLIILLQTFPNYQTNQSRKFIDELFTYNHNLHQQIIKSKYSLFNLLNQLILNSSSKELNGNILNSLLSLSATTNFKTLFTTIISQLNNQTSPTETILNIMKFLVINLVQEKKEFEFMFQNILGLLQNNNSDDVRYSLLNMLNLISSSNQFSPLLQEETNKIIDHFIEEYFNLSNHLTICFINIFETLINNVVKSNNRFELYKVIFNIAATSIQSPREIGMDSILLLRKTYHKNEESKLFITNLINDQIISISKLFATEMNFSDKEYGELLACFSFLDGSIDLYRGIKVNIIDRVEIGTIIDCSIISPNCTILLSHSNKIISIEKEKLMPIWGPTLQNYSINSDLLAGYLSIIGQSNSDFQFIKLIAIKSLFHLIENFSNFKLLQKEMDNNPSNIELFAQIGLQSQFNPVKNLDNHFLHLKEAKLIREIIYEEISIPQHTNFLNYNFPRSLEVLLNRDPFKYEENGIKGKNFYARSKVAIPSTSSCSIIEFTINDVPKNSLSIFGLTDDNEHRDYPHFILALDLSLSILTYRGIEMGKMNLFPPPNRCSFIYFPDNGEVYFYCNSNFVCVVENVYGGPFYPAILSPCESCISINKYEQLIPVDNLFSFKRLLLHPRFRMGNPYVSTDKILLSTQRDELFSDENSIDNKNTIVIIPKGILTNYNCSFSLREYNENHPIFAQLKSPLKNGICKVLCKDLDHNFNEVVQVNSIDLLNSTPAFHLNRPIDSYFDCENDLIIYYSRSILLQICEHSYQRNLDWISSRLSSIVDVYIRDKLKPLLNSSTEDRNNVPILCNVDDEFTRFIRKLFKLESGKQLNESPSLQKLFSVCFDYSNSLSKTEINFPPLKIIFNNSEENTKLKKEFGGITGNYQLMIGNNNSVDILTENELIISVNGKEILITKENLKWSFPINIPAHSNIEIYSITRSNNNNDSVELFFAKIISYEPLFEFVWWIFHLCKKEERNQNLFHSFVEQTHKNLLSQNSQITGRIEIHLLYIIRDLIDLYLGIFDGSISNNLDIIPIEELEQFLYNKLEKRFEEECNWGNIPSTTNYEHLLDIFQQVGYIRSILGKRSLIQDITENIIFHPHFYSFLKFFDSLFHFKEISIGIPKEFLYKELKCSEIISIDLDTFYKGGIVKFDKEFESVQFLPVHKNLNSVMQNITIDNSESFRRILPRKRFFLTDSKNHLEITLDYDDMDSSKTLKECCWCETKASVIVCFFITIYYFKDIKINNRNLKSKESKC